MRVCLDVVQSSYIAYVAVESAVSMSVSKLFLWRDVVQRALVDW